MTNVWEVLPDVPSARAKIATNAVTLGDSVYVVGGYWVKESGFETTTVSANRKIRRSERL